MTNAIKMRCSENSIPARLTVVLNRKAKRHRRDRPKKIPRPCKYLQKKAVSQYGLGWPSAIDGLHVDQKQGRPGMMAMGYEATAQTSLPASSRGQGQ